MNVQSLLDLVTIFARLGLLAMGSSATTLGDMGREVAAHGWMTAEQFATAYAFNQIAPGPGMLMVVPIGYEAAGAPGIAAVVLAYFLPTAIVVALVTRGWNRLRQWPWGQAIRVAVTPVACGLILAAVCQLARNTIHDIPSLAIGAAAFLLLWRTKAPAVAVIVGSVGVGMLAGLLPA